jgi:dTDP-D-glucose 4,6-dehydratase
MLGTKALIEHVPHDISRAPMFSLRGNLSTTIIEFLIWHLVERPGHDLSYSLEWDRMKAMGWQPQVPFEEGLMTTVEWYLANKPSWEPIAPP